MMKKIENIKNLDNIETQLQNDGFTFDNGECVFEGMPDGIASEKDKIEYLQNSEVVYFDNKKIYGINVDELGDYEVVDFKIRREIQEFIDSTSSEDSDESSEDSTSEDSNGSSADSDDDFVDEFINNGEKKLIELLPDYYVDEIPVGWSQHFVDEYLEFDDGFATIVNFKNKKIIYHVYVDEDMRGQGKGKEILTDVFNQGIRVVFNPNFEMCNLLMALDQDEGITFSVIEPDRTSGCYLPKLQAEEGVL